MKSIVSDREAIGGYLTNDTDDYKLVLYMLLTYSKP